MICVGPWTYDYKQITNDTLGPIKKKKTFLTPSFCILSNFCRNYLTGATIQWHTVVAVLASHHFCTNRTCTVETRNNRRVLDPVKVNANWLFFCECEFQSNARALVQYFVWNAISLLDFVDEYFPWMQQNCRSDDTIDLPISFLLNYIFYDLMISNKRMTISNAESTVFIMFSETFM